MKIDTKKLITSPKFIKFVYYFIRTYSATFRLKVENEDKWMQLHKNEEKIILCTWHQHFFSFIRYFKNYKNLKPSLMISRSSDGELIAGVANLTGWHTARGSSSKGGRTALEEMTNKIDETGLGAHIIDGPTGPAGIVKNGAVKMAASLGAYLVPMYTISDKDWHASSWDKFLIPKPFSKVTILYGDPVYVEKTDDVDVMEKYRKQLETTMKPYLKYFE
ncbi:MAG: lysophospholipid acyltransferase family protein [Thermodesulfobacteriota bacterium]